MKIVANLVAALLATGLIAAGCVYIFDPREARKLLKSLVLSLAALLLFSTILAELTEEVTAFAAIFILAAISLIAYVLRQRRLGPQEGARHIARAEREPVMPRTEEDA